jgi:CheY-like chemotaxis protein
LGTETGGVAIPTVLIVEDDADLRRMIRLTIGLAGYRVTEAANGQAGLRALDTDRPDLIVCDLDLPTMNGHAVCAELTSQAELRDIPVVVITGGPTTEMTTPVECLLRKPFSPEGLLLSVRRCMKHRPRRQVRSETVPR